MPIFTDEEKQTGSSEDFLKLLENQKKVDPKGEGRMKSILSKFPLPTIILIVLVIILGVFVVSLELRVSGLASELDEARKLKTQLAGIETKLDELGRDRQKLKSDLTQVKSDVDNLRAFREKAEAERLRQQELAKKKMAAQKQPAQKPSAQKPSVQKPAAQKPGEKKVKKPQAF